jgi:TolB-like protein
MKMSASSDIFLFADFRFDHAGGGLFRRDEHGGFAPVAIGSRALDLLAVLIEQGGDVVSKEEIMASVWPKMAVEEANLFVQISALRAILDREQSGQSCIQTVTGRGYRFIAPATRCAGLRSPPAGMVEPTRADSPSKRVDGGPPRLSIVVLPFANLSGDPKQDYFADGVTESLTTDLSRLRNSFVIARNTAFAYRGKPMDVRAIGRELNVRYALEGSVQRGGDRMRVSAQLIDAESGAHLWADRFDKLVADFLDMQDEIVARLAGQLQAKLIDAEARRAVGSTNPDSLDLYFQGEALIQEGLALETLIGARTLFSRALDIDCGHVDALVGMALVEIVLVGSHLPGERAAHIAAAESAAVQALSLAPNHALAQGARRLRIQAGVGAQS